jgi:hypothetical protein
MKQTRDPLPKYLTTKYIKSQELDLVLKLREAELKCITLAEYIAAKKGISMDDYNNYNIAMAGLKEQTDTYNTFTLKFKNSLNKKQNK